MIFNQEQKIAVNHFNGPMLVTAGPGSGKTAVIVHRIKNLTDNHQVSPGQILTVTFTRAAAAQMENRYRAISGSNSGRPVFGTFHSVFYQILKKSVHKKIKIISESERYNIIRSELERFSYDISDIEETVSDVSAQISRYKSSLSAHELPEYMIPDPDTFLNIYRAYQTVLHTSGMIDYDDILINTYRLLTDDNNSLCFWQDYFQYIQIDEFQDINEIQYKIMLLLCRKHENIFAVGDADQSIYGFRGATPKTMRQFSSDLSGCRMVTLRINYRCPQAVLKPSLRLISKDNKDCMRYISGTEPDNSGSFSITQYTDQETEYKEISDIILKLHANGTDYSEMAILIRSSADRTYISGILAEKGIPCSDTGQSRNIFKHFISQDILCYFKAACNMASRKDLLRIINRPSRYISANALTESPQKDLFPYMKRYYKDNPSVLKRISKLEYDLGFLARLTPSAGIDYVFKAIGYNDFVDRNAECEKTTETLKKHSCHCKCLKDFIEYAEKSCDISDQTPEINEGIKIMTMHASKGLEFKAVFIPDLNEKIIPSSHADNVEAVQEERRLLYVAMTRASENLYMSYCRYLHSKISERSVFIDEILQRSGNV